MSCTNGLPSGYPHQFDGRETAEKAIAATASTVPSGRAGEPAAGPLRHHRGYGKGKPMSDGDPRDLPTQTSDRPMESAFVRAIKATLRAMELRARLYRNLVVSVVTVALASLLSSALLWSWVPLLGMSLLVPLSGGFLLLDSRRLRRWRAEVINLWRFADLDLGVFEKSIRLDRRLPAHTLEGMLATLPEDRAGLTEADKAALTEQLERHARREQRQTLMGIGALLSAIGLLIAAAVTQSLAWLGGAVASMGVLALARRR